MALNQTNVTIVGRLASAPDHRMTMNDVDVTHFRLASNERRFDRQAEQWVNGDQLFVDVTCWRRLAFNVSACLVKGDPVVVTGRLYTYEYEVEGNRRSSIRMEASAVGPDLSWITAAVRRRQQRAGVDAAADAVEQQPEVVGELADAVDRAAEAVGPAAEAVDRAAEAVDPAAEAVDPAAGAVDPAAEAVDELARRLLDQPPQPADAHGLLPAEREEALMAMV
jgi:single-strand DNA-binding protein